MSPTTGVGLLATRLDLFDQYLKDVVDVTHDGYVHLHVLGDGRRIDVHVHDLGVRTELFDIARHAIIEARTNGNDQIGIVHAHIGLICPVHAQHADELPVSGWVTTQAHEGVGDGVIQQLGEVGE